MTPTSLLTSLNNCPAPAKLNLFLHINGRRDDGYHLLQTVFQLVDHGDTLHFALRGDQLIRRTTILPGVPEEQDLIIRAAKLLQAEVLHRTGALPRGVDIAIDKVLPMGGGLGGGSSDAATALMALNRLWQAGLTREELMALGLPLGADIPFFIFGENAFAEGVGEALQPVTTPDCWYVVIEPGVQVPTAAIFSAEGLTRDSEPVTIADFSRHLTKSNSVSGFGKNDLQQVASSLFKPVADAVEWLNAYGEARMTGSGACVFSAFSSSEEADAVLSNVPDIWIAWKAKALSRHPMLAVL
ncbi:MULTISPECIES: 4-(cytidine 5'-diphospho)-2-C-methyl-D-erythritol kinase [unclassified Janthinobacterium]|uniref:4-(cytidine 5'-diphospho)-2-C-methyl-D-erythritol kinase n=1 Tax=unclassified Janthinobacterium TaxID=2610881 RepID=UPI0016197429|nr:MULTISPECIES: 4-(cytidine 5'-diphospho)-2-C-methyl-D-erythritol kinase [unclassified Janthinobacterium]MBB5370800.1 4-diphosphocytidyl-2-C-methyl-D-erythritol kinase [Janthinobacterium sp. K2C7]MBB5383606.1 4-diphosphocytidyl-2-C-methyl-D-erythritol kinase [Janthinobacterium sp. K2Li3]MBB5389060.1 4-diphosphocytidyl-2-C-methyl-D-erythritol kinase [Janthinobacterium sp. K2E3]